MNLRSRATPHHPGIQLAPLVDVLLLLLIFFSDLERRAKRKRARCQSAESVRGQRRRWRRSGDVIVNVKADGNVVVNRRNDDTAGIERFVARIWCN